MPQTQIACAGSDFASVSIFTHTCLCEHIETPTCTLHIIAGAPRKNLHAASEEGRGHFFGLWRGSPKPGLISTWGRYEHSPRHGQSWAGGNVGPGGSAWGSSRLSVPGCTQLPVSPRASAAKICPGRENSWRFKNLGSCLRILVLGEHLLLLSQAESCSSHKVGVRSSVPEPQHSLVSASLCPYLYTKVHNCFSPTTFKYQKRCLYFVFNWSGRSVLFTKPTTGMDFLPVIFLLH